ncbi:Glucokinase [Spironucleus salmonicida]|uniref:Glucokinase n=2 Tax=Spironucleus salmonicida TaxID=348837 RepID=A0A9P8LKM7_9EUKA|nr:Glucokinase [Spironucleus salmonicida]
MGCVNQSQIIIAHPQSQKGLNSHICIVGDIGGTNLRLALMKDGSIIFRANYLTEDHPTLVSAIISFLKQYGIKHLTCCCLALAGPIEANKCEMTNENTNYIYDSQQFSKQLNCPVSFINDFAAIGCGIQSHFWDQIQKEQFSRSAAASDTAVYLGAGSGLGLGFIVNGMVYPTEGGHMRYSAASEVEFALVAYLCHDLGTKHVSFERLLSGAGIGALYDFFSGRPISALAAFCGVASTDAREVREVLKADMRHNLKARYISEQSHQCEVAALVMRAFLTVLARFIAEVVALFDPARVIICGGIVAKNTHLLDAAMVGVLTGACAGRELTLVKDEEVSLFGCFAHIQRLDAGVTKAPQ